MILSHRRSAKGVTHSRAIFPSCVDLSDAAAPAADESPKDVPKRKKLVVSRDDACSFRRTISEHRRHLSRGVTPFIDHVEHVREQIAISRSVAAGAAAKTLKREPTSTSGRVYPRTSRSRTIYNDIHILGHSREEKTPLPRFRIYITFCRFTSRDRATRNTSESKTRRDISRREAPSHSSRD